MCWALGSHSGNNDADDDDTCGPCEGGELDGQVEGIVRSSAIFPPRFIVTCSASWSYEEEEANGDDGYYDDDHGHCRI